jgi:hypothetical protein
LGFQSEERVQIRSHQWALQERNAQLHKMSQEQSQFGHVQIQLTIDGYSEARQGGILEKKAT